MVIPREVLSDPVETTRRPRKLTKAYLLGVLHDGTARRATYRVATKSKPFAEFLSDGICEHGSGAWIYKEGMTRDLWIVEFPRTLLRDFVVISTQDKIDYVRGYFDSEGGIARSTKVRYYIYFAQKDLFDLEQVHGYLEDVGISCGVIHNPSKKADPEYFRFFLRAKSYIDFAELIGSYHPDKVNYLRVKI